MRRAAFVITILVQGAIALLAREHPDLSGTWTMDPARSESAHQVVPVRSCTLVIQMTHTGVSIETTRVDDGDAPAFHERLHFNVNGPETTSPGHADVLVTGTARWNGDKLVIDTARNINGSTVTTRYVYALSGKDLTVDKTLSVQHGYQGRFGTNTGRGVDVFVRALR